MSEIIVRSVIEDDKFKNFIDCMRNETEKNFIGQLEFATVQREL